jgi:hypothetical protein
MMSRFDRSTVVFLKAKHGTKFVVPYGRDLPKRTCKKYGVILEVISHKDLQIQIVTVLKWRKIIMLTKEIKKGARIQLRNGWYGTMMDNKSGTTRMVNVEGVYTEIGSVYSFDIAYVLVNGSKIPVDYTKKELDVKDMNDSIFGF